MLQEKASSASIAYRSNLSIETCEYWQPRGSKGQSCTANGIKKEGADAPSPFLKSLK